MPILLHDTPPISRTAPARTMIALPRTDLRKRELIVYVKLLRRVRVDRHWGGWRFDGDLWKPGSRVPLDTLPDPAVCIEHAGIAVPGWGHRRSEYLYILWTLDRDRLQWREVAHTRAASWEWTSDLGPVAQRLLERPALTDGQIREQVEEVLLRFTEALEGLEDADRQKVCAALYDRLAAGAVN